MTVKNYSSATAGASVLSGTAGALQAVLRACLVTGYGSRAVQSLVVAAGIATVTYATAHPYSAGAVLRVAGAGLAAANGERRVASVTTNALTFALPGAPDGAVSGSITTDIAPAGWAEVYTAGAVSVFKPTALEATGMLLRVDDSGTTSARAIGYEAMTDANTGTGLFPSAAQKAGGVYLGKSMSANSTAMAWRLWADERGFLLWIAINAAQTYGSLYGFGDIAATKSGDAYGVFISGKDSTDLTGTSIDCLGSSIGGTFGSYSAQGLYLPRLASGIGSAVRGSKTAAGCSNNSSAFSGTSNYFVPITLPYPNPADNSLRLAGLDVVVAGDGTRGSIPGLLHTPQVMGEAFQVGDLLTGQNAWAGRTLVALRVGSANSGITSAGTVFIDATGPWSR